MTAVKNTSPYSEEFVARMKAEFPDDFVAEWLDEGNSYGIGMLLEGYGVRTVTISAKKVLGAFVDDDTKSSAEKVEALLAKLRKDAELQVRRYELYRLFEEEPQVQLTR